MGCIKPRGVEPLVGYVGADGGAAQQSAAPAAVDQVAGPPAGAAIVGARGSPPPPLLPAAPAAAAQDAVAAPATVPRAAPRPRPATWADAVVGGRGAAPAAVTGGRRPPPRGGQTKDAVAVAAAAPAATNKAKDGDAAAAAAARLARATAAGAALRRLAAGSPPPVTLRTVYVRGVARESRTWRLRELLSGATGLPKRAVVDVDRAGDLAEVRLLAQHADAFEAAVALSPAAATLTLVRDVDPLSPSLLGAPRRRGLSAEAAIETARAFFVARRRAKLSSLDARVGMPPAHRDALRPLLHRELAPHVRQLAAGGGAVGGRVALPAAAAAGAAADGDNGGRSSARKARRRSRKKSIWL